MLNANMAERERERWIWNYGFLWHKNGDENFPTLFLRVTLHGKQMIQCFVRKQVALASFPSDDVAQLHYDFSFFYQFWQSPDPDFDFAKFYKETSSIFTIYIYIFFFLGSKRRVLITFIFYFKLFLNGKVFTIFYLKLKLSKCYI